MKRATGFFVLLVLSVLLIPSAHSQPFQLHLNLGNQPNDGTGDPLRTTFSKIETNFSTLFSKFPPGPSTNQIVTGAAGPVQSVQWSRNPDGLFGGDSNFTWDSSNQVLGVNGLIALTNALNGPLNPLAFAIAAHIPGSALAGLTNGTTDATGYIQAAINACPPGGEVRLPAGIFAVTNTIALGSLATPMITLRGASFNQTIILAHQTNLPIVTMGGYKSIRDLTLQYAYQQPNTATNSIGLALDNLQNSSSGNLNIYNTCYGIAGDPAAVIRWGYNSVDFSCTWDTITIGSFSGRAIYKNPVNAGSSGSFWRNIYIYNQAGFRGNTNLITTDTAVWEQASEDAFLGLNIEWGIFTGHAAYFQDCAKIILHAYHNEGLTMSNYNIGMIGLQDSAVDVVGHTIRTTTIPGTYDCAAAVLTSGSLNVRDLVEAGTIYGTTNAIFYRFLDFPNVAPKMIVVSSGWNQSVYNVTNDMAGDAIHERNALLDLDALAIKSGLVFPIATNAPANSMQLPTSGYLGMGMGNPDYDMPYNLQARANLSSGRADIDVRGFDSSMILRRWNGALVTNVFTNAYNVVITNIQPMYYSARLHMGAGTNGTVMAIERDSHQPSQITNETWTSSFAIDGLGNSFFGDQTNDLGKITLNLQNSDPTLEMYRWSGVSNLYSAGYILMNGGDLVFRHPSNFTQPIGSETMVDSLRINRDTGNITASGNLSLGGAPLPVTGGLSVGALTPSTLAAVDGSRGFYSMTNSPGSLVNNGSGAFSFVNGSTGSFIIAASGTNWTFAVTNGIATISHSP